MLLTNKYVKNINDELIILLFIAILKLWSQFYLKRIRKSSGWMKISFCSLCGNDTNHLQWYSLLNDERHLCKRIEQFVLNFSDDEFPGVHRYLGMCIQVILSHESQISKHESKPNMHIYTYVTTIPF